MTLGTKFPLTFQFRADDQATKATESDEWASTNRTYLVAWEGISDLSTVVPLTHCSPPTPGPTPPRQPLLSLPYGQLLLALLHTEEQAWRGGRSPRDHRSKGRWLRTQARPVGCPATHLTATQPRPGQRRRKPRLRERSPSKLLPKRQDMKELKGERLGNMRSWELNVEGNRISED